ncbi:MAG: glycoside hydrolase family 3 N-terminal domain-containing protein [Bacilli bacterium]
MKKIVRQITFSVLSLVSIGALIAADSVYNTYRTDIIGYLCPPIIDQDAASVAASSGKDLAQKVEEEGIVMVKNDGTLPLSTSNVSKVNILGFGAVQWIYGGSGSGRVLSQNGDSNWDSNIDIADAFDEYGIDVNTDLLDYYKSYASVSHDIDSLNFNVDTTPYRFGLKDPDVNESAYSSLLDQAIDYSDTAIVVIGRQGGESEDMPAVQYKSKPTQTTDTERHSLQISTEEEDLLYYANDNFENVIVVVNSTNAFQLDFLADMNNIDSCMIVGPTGEYGALAIPKVIYGEASPSGKLADTLPYDFTQNLSYEYSGYEGVSFYKNYSGAYGVNQTTNGGVTKRPSLPYLDYVEGIYVGYRYYETADAENSFATEKRQVLDQNGSVKEVSGYDAVVQYPFGFGLSYTTFDWEIIDMSVNNNSKLTADSEITLTISVTNTGDVAGKDVVELYSTPQYNDGEVEKSTKNLVAFAKTESIEPTKSQAVTLTVTARDLASYDCYDKNDNGYTTYEIDKGTYKLTLGTDAHNTKTIDFLGGDKNVTGVLTYTADEDIILDKDSVTNETIGNLFTGADAVDGVSVDGLGADGENADIPYVERTDFATLNGPIPQSSTHDVSTAREMGAETQKYVLFSGANSLDKTKATAWDNATTDEFGQPVSTEDVTFGASGSLKVTSNSAVTDLGYQLGADFDDPQWDDLLSQVSYSEAMTMVNDAHPNCSGIASIGMPKLYSLDGPAQCGSFAGVSTRGVGYPANCVLAQTFSKTLAYEFGLSMGQDMNAHGLDGLYGTAINIHRSPFSGRNYEYYSEDPILTGDLASQVTKGIRHTGRLSFIKHFAVAETETSRDSLYTWLSEQALREIYLEPFRRVVQDGGANGIMTSYSRVGALWSGGSAALMKGVLRKEWGFKGMVITDYSDNNQFMNMDETLRQSGTLGMSVSLKFSIDSKSTPRIKQALKDAVHYNVYAYLNSQYSLKEYNKNPYEGNTITSVDTKESFNWVDPIIIDINIAIIVLAAGLVYFGALNGLGLNFRLGKKKDEKTDEPLKEEK